jgi:acetyl esterase/lipase
MMGVRRPAPWRFGLVLAAASVLAGCGHREPASVEVTRDLRYTTSTTLDVFALPSGDGRPVVVTIHGCCGTRKDLLPLAMRLAAGGAVVFNASWPNFVDGGRYPTSYQEVGCAVRFARAQALRFGGDPSRVTLVAWSDGALIGGVVTNLGDSVGGECPAGVGNARPEAFVALGGFLGWPAGEDGWVDPAYVTPRTVDFFGGTPAARPDAWAGGNPYASLGRGAQVPIRLLVGSDDELRAGNERFAEAARAAGHSVDLVVVDGASNLSLLSTGLPEGRRAVAEVLRTAGSGSTAAP